MIILLCISLLSLWCYHLLLIHQLSFTTMTVNAIVAANVTAMGTAWQAHIDGHGMYIIV